MQSTTRWCLNEGSMPGCTYDQNECSICRINLRLFPIGNRPSKFTGHLSECNQAGRVGFDSVSKCQTKDLSEHSWQTKPF